MKCPVCGGVFTCPANDYLLVLPVEDEDILYVPRGNPAPEGYRITHQKKRYSIAIRVKKSLPDGRVVHLELVGSAQSGRIETHYGVRGRWVGMCTYAFYTLPAGTE